DLAFAQYIVRHYDAPGGPAILTALAQHHTVRQVANAKAYEMVSNGNGLHERHRGTGEKRLPDDGTVTWQDNLATRRYPTGRAPPQLRGGKVTIEQVTSYPFAGKVRLTVTPDKNGAKFPLRLRVPAWAPRATVVVAGKPAAPATPGGYATITRSWRRGDVVE